MQPTDELIAALDREDIDQARRMNFAQKVLAGAELFDSACAVTRSGIRMQNPSFNEAQVTAELRRRLELSAKWEERA